MLSEAMLIRWAYNLGTTEAWNADTSNNLTEWDSKISTIAHVTRVFFNDCLERSTADAQECIALFHIEHA